MPPKAKHQHDEESDSDHEGMQIDPRMLAQLQARLQGASSGYVESLPKEVQRRVKALKNLQVKHAKLNAEYEKEVAALELKYAGLHKPLFEKRTTITSGAYEPTDEEAHFSEEEEEDDEDEEEKKDDKKESTTDDAPVKGIPQFWLTVLQRSDLIAEKIQEHDIPVLEHLTDITIVNNADAGTGFLINFHFSPNDFFTDDVLTKTYTIDLGGVENAVMYEGPVFSTTTGCEIHWKAGKNVTVKAIKKKQKKKGGKDAGAVRVVTKIEKVDSFFNFFSPPEQPNEDNPKGAEIMAAIEEDFEIGDIIREKLVPNAVLWFTGEALDYEGYGDDYDENEDGEDAEGGDDDDEDADADYKPKPKAKGAAAPGAAGAKPECKQS